MVKAAGVDPGTGSMDILAFDDEGMRLIAEVSVPRVKVTENPRIILEILEATHAEHRLDAIVAPSGYGIPLKPAREASDSEIRLATFVNCKDRTSSLQINGLRKLMEMIRASTLPAWFTPGVIHLPTVPAHRRVGKVDLGTADKVYTVAAALAVEREKHGVPPGDINVIVVEAGMAYTSVILVEAGMIVDAIAGTAGFPGFLGAGCMDAETAYALATVMPGFSKRLLFSGGIASIYGIRTPAELEEGLRTGHTRAEQAARALAEYTVKAVSALLASASSKIKRIYFSGRLSWLPLLALPERVRRMLARLGVEVALERPLRLGRETKEGATGAALIANGIAGGRYEWIVESLRLRESRGNVFSGLELLERGAGLRAERFFGEC